MFIHEVLLIPGYGQTSDDGQYVMGKKAPDLPYCEIDVVDGYVDALAEELECESIRTRVLPTRNGAGIKQSERHKHIEPNSLVVHCLAGWTKSGGRNTTQISYGPAQSFSLADEMAEAIGQWGHCYVFGHKTRNPRQDETDPLLNAPDTKAIAIEPFALNGPDVATYMKYLDQLGRVIARALADHLNQRGQARTSGPQLAPTT